MRNSITFHKGGVGISVSVYLFQDGGAFVAYCPSLDLTGYDLTEDAARRDFEFVLNDWLREQTANGTLRQDLEAHGWKIGEEDKGSEPVLRDLLRSNKNAARVLTKPEYRKTNIRARVACR